MKTLPLKITLIQHPSLALKVKGFRHPDFDQFQESGIYLGNIYRKIIPAGLPRLASILEEEIGADVDILDLRIAGWSSEENYKVIDWEGYTIDVNRIGAPFDDANEAIRASDWIGLSSLFTSESAIVRDLIAHAKKINPSVKVMVGGPDVKARPRDYLAFGADLVFSGDFHPEAFLEANGRPKIVPPYLHPFEKLTKFAFDKLEHLDMYTDTHDGPAPEGVPFPVGFIHFTRGCPRDCDFCESRKTSFELLDWDLSIEMLEHYKKSGIRTLNFSDDNLLLMAAKPAGRERLIAMLNTMREMKFAWEYPNGLEIGRLSKKGKIDEELMAALFSHEVDPQTGEISGAYRVYIPVETFDFRENYRKLKSSDEQRNLIDWIAHSGIPELDFGVVLPPSATEETFFQTQRGYRELQEVITAYGQTRARYAVFHLIPIALFRNMATKYSMEDFPEGWNFYFPVYDGEHFSAGELFERRLRLIKEIDRSNFQAMQTGQYSYT